MLMIRQSDAGDVNSLRFWGRRRAMIGITAFCPNESQSAERLSYVGDVAPSTRIRGNELS